MRGAPGWQAISVHVFRNGIRKAFNAGFAQCANIRGFDLAQTGPGEQRITAFGRVKHTVQIGAQHLVIGAAGTIGALTVMHHRPVQIGTAADACMDLVTAYRCRAKAQAAFPVVQLLLRLQRRLHGQIAHAAQAAGRTFETERVVDLHAEHLKTPTDADEFAAIA